MVEMIQKYLKDEIELEYGKGLTRNQRKKGKIPVYGSNGIVDYNDKACFQGPGIIIGRKGTVGSVKYEKNDFWAIDTTYVVKLKNENEDSIFWYYFLQTLGLEKMNSHSAVPGLNRDRVYNIKINIPKEQEDRKKMSRILRNFDKKIESNNKMNNNLYELSRTIFNELYKESENWQNCKIQDIGLYITDYVANGSFKSLADNVKIYDTKNYALFVRNTDLKVNFTQERKYVDEHSYNFLSKSKLIGRELIISNVGDVGSIYLCPSYKTPMTLGNNVIMVNSKDLKVNYNYYLYYFFLSIDGQYLIDGITGGSAQPKFNKTDFRNSIIKIPSDDEIVEFNKKIIPLYDIIEKNIMENETLYKLRDTLLPKLMNGEIDLDNIEI